MYSPRPILVDAAVGRNLLQKERHRLIDTVTVDTVHRRTQSMMALAEYGATSLNVPRLPSRRPIDQRWDRSREIIFSNAQRNAIQDFTWCRGDAIVFADTTFRKRGVRDYSSRPPIRPPPPKSNRQESGQQNRMPAAMSDPNAISAATFGRSGNVLQEKEQYRHQLELERMGREEDRSRMNAQMSGLRAEKDRQIGDSRRENAKLVRDLKMQEDKIVQLEDMQKRLKQLETHAQSVQKREVYIEKEKADLDAKIVDAQHGAKCAARKEVEDARTSAEQAQQRAIDEATRHREQYYQGLELVKEEFHKTLKGWEGYEDKLDSLVEIRYGDELREAREAAKRRVQERADYDTYRRVWQATFRIADDLMGEVNSLSGVLARRTEFWNEALSKYDGAQIHTWFPYKYPRLDRRLREYLQSCYEEEEKRTASFKDIGSDLQTIQETLSRRGHRSRQLTRYFKFADRPDSYGIVALAQEFLSAEPIVMKRDQLDQEIMQMDRSLNTTDAKGRREILERQRHRAKSQRAFYSKLLVFIMRAREVEALKALQQDTPMNKEVFLATQKLHDGVGGARRAFYDLKEESPKPVNVSDIDQHDRNKDKKQFLETHDLSLAKIQRVEAHMRKRYQLQVLLGRVKEDDTQRFDAQLKSQIDKAESLLRDAVDSYSGTRSIVLRPGSASIPSTVPLAPRSIRKEAAAHARSQRDLDSRMANLEAKLEDRDKYTGEDERRKDEEELHEARRRSRRSTRTMKTLSLQSSATANDSKPEEDEKQITKGQAHLSAGSQEPETLKKTSEVQARMRRTRKTRRRERMARDMVRDAASDHTGSGTGPEAVRTASSEEKQEQSSSGINFKPSVAQQAPYTFWPTSLRYFRPEGSKAAHIPESVESALPSKDTILLSQAVQHHSVPSYAQASESRTPMKIASDNSSSDASPAEQSFYLSSDSDGIYQPSEASTNLIAAAQSLDISDQDPSPVPSQPVASTTPSQDTAEMAPEVKEVDQAGSDTELTYQIPAADLRNAMLSSKTTQSAYWSHTLYKNGNNRRPAVLYCTNYDQTEARAKEFLNESILGFDIEWEMWAMPGKASIKRNVSLIQIAAEDRIGLFQVALFKGETAQQLMPPSLRALMESRDIVKVGVNIQGDAKRLKECLDVDMTGLFELSHLYKVVMHSENTPSLVNKKLVKLSEQVQNVLMLPLKKDDVRVSAWSKKLNLEQTDYAASDAYAGFRLYHALEAKRKKMNPTPPRPAFYEDQQPLQLADGRLVIPKPYNGKRKLGAVNENGKVAEEDDEEEEDDEYFDALECLDAYQLESSQSSSQSAGVPLAGLAVAYPTLPGPQENTTLGETIQTASLAAPNQPESTEAPTTRPIKRSHPPSSPEITLAETWISILRPTHHIRATHASLRAYHLWHHQRLSCPEVAALLRQPPLQLQTVATYILQALREGDGVLGFEGGRVREVVSVLPASVRGRYSGLLERVEREERE